MTNERVRRLLRTALEGVYIGDQLDEADALLDKFEDVGLVVTAPRVIPPAHRNPRCA